MEKNMMCKDGAKETFPIIINAENYNIFPSTIPHETCLSTPWGRYASAYESLCCTVASVQCV